VIESPKKITLFFVCIIIKEENNVVKIIERKINLNGFSIIISFVKNKVCGRYKKVISSKW
jgi:hypothetical protein